MPLNVTFPLLNKHLGKCRPPRLGVVYAGYILQARRF